MKLSGVMPALITPFDANNKIDFKAFERLLIHLREAGVTGWVPNGSTGEYFSQSREERRDVLQFVKDFARPDEILIAGTNAPATREVIEQTALARDIGYDTILLAPPFYTRPTQAELIKHYEAVLGAVDVNLVLYSYPAKDGSDISFELMDHFADNRRVIGIKESSGVLQRAIDIASRYEGKIQLVSGSDDIALDFMFWGAESWICGPSNCMAKACCALDRTFRSGDLNKAREQMKTLYRAMNILESGKFVQKIKYGCELQGLPVGQCRAPLGELTSEEKAEFRAAMQPILNW
ncbi:dihydrodipicolinate synthase (plasmid) [Rhizobium leguminosarum bv. trifolii CB782]|uniref:Dihydrodipicolinate synthase family protein n=1 Tax=Rhizobium hidalgonense TaxID=1538159 RepID=A0A2A6K7U1_9HYPH|nr:dihydrodipicolinate synthase family protein [Rhizobium hidalgonense]AHG49375.1 dihydrodipicolinate synthase [Rhizobium leguminosarum bv. trifolii CB782]EJC75490.1 dihydrodipicolinate synthase/N-acetylneuraminate lyase [Rhizobium leguminosarum bv. trifolii WSM2012]MDR9773145.1 dihydrodipicolinate synthase family protein [Rhizobium hidalgonense]MDR9810557.1 dihydrodipicolinate synthase family protein [Rhizobium hidalgonense]MDR9819185.1 dihydrodipicolinate synthase family protein [Rhizobium h